MKFHSFNKWIFHPSCRYEEQVYIDWTKDVGSISQENLDKPLILRDSNTKLIKVNFDPQVCFPRHFVFVFVLFLYTLHLTCTSVSSVYIFDSYFLFTAIRDGEAKEILNCLVRSLFFF